MFLPDRRAHLISRMSAMGRALPFLTALILYACFSSPTPDAFGWAECVIGILLILALGIPTPARIPAPEGILFIYGLSIPLIIGAVAGHDRGMILRDLIAFAFLLLPLFFAKTMQKHQGLMIGAVTIIGVVFSVRALIPYQGDLFHPSYWLGQPPRDLLYLANSPEVLFSALYMGGVGAWLIWSRKSTVGGFALCALASLPMLAMSVMMQRAGIGCVLIAGLLLTGIGMWIRPARTLVVLGVIVILALPVMALAQDILAHLIYKTRLVGFNSRQDEWATVLHLVEASPFSLLFGRGWGMVFENPAVGNLTVNYTHSLFSALLLKTGLVGVGLCLLYIGVLIRAAAPILARKPVLAMALLAPLGIGFFLYASYKCLGFGLLLILLANQGSAENLDKNQRDMA